MHHDIVVAGGAETVMALYATMALASFARSMPLVLKVRTISSRPKRLKNAWTQTRLLMGADKMSLRLIWNVLNRVCLAMDSHYMASFYHFISICITPQN